MKNKKLHNKISLLVVILSLTVASTIYSSFKPQNTLEIPKTSAGEISILTPENITYTEPMSGYYPATYGFENDQVGTIPEGWTDESPYSSCSISVYDQKDQHKQIVQIYDANTGTGADATAQYNFESPKVTGIIECWVYKESGDCALIIQGNNDTTAGFQISIDAENNGVFRYSSAPSTYVEFATGKYSDQKWFHLRIDFDCDTDTIDIYVNGIKEVDDGSFVLPVPHLSFILIRSGHSGRSGILYFDAVGLSWDPSYSIGDNLNEGLLLSYDNTTTLEWQGFSLDGQANKTILGNTTILMPADGVHSIQVFGNESLGSMYESNLRYFTVDTNPYINIVTPENKTYTEPDIGYYPATYGFENDLVGNDPYEWTVAEPGLQTVEVISGLDGHNNVLELFDTESGSGAQALANNSFAPQTSGIIEFWYRTSGFQEHISIRGQEDNDIALYFSSESGNFAFYNDSDWHIIAACNNDQWYHIKFVFDCTSDTYDFYLDGALILSNIDFYTTVSSLNKIVFVTRQWGTSSDFYGYVDALGYSWDPSYDIGDNLNESLLLSYDSITSLDWQGYSLDGQENVTITGNTTLPMLSNGLHSVQVFGNDSIGNNYQSNLIYFTVRFNNNIEPELTHGNVSPRIGDQTTEFNFTLTFWDEDNNLPSYVNVVINGTVYAMEKTFPSDDNYTDGCYYEYTTFLLPSEYNYSYYFECSDGKYTNTTTVFNNLIVNKVNYNSPQLLFPEVSPDYGGLTTDFVFNIWYYDLDNNYPLDINITIDTSTFSMIRVNSADTNATDGIEFSYTTNLDYGIHNFQFNCSDGLYSNSTNWIVGPEVNPLYGIDPIELLTPSTYSQIYSILLNFSWSSLDAGFGVVNFTLQVSNATDFSHIIFQSEDIAETPIVTNFSVPLSITQGQYYWRVRSTYGNYNGSWSEYFSFTFHINIYTPNLVLDDITPTGGTSSTIFRFTVIYSDLDNNAPEYVKILINGTPYSMEMVHPLDEDFTDGCIYQYLTLLTPSTSAYTISFECSDGGFYESTSTFIGPLVESEGPPDGEQGLDNLNSANLFAIIMTLGITIGILIPSIAFAEKKVRKMKLGAGEKTSTKIKKKENPK